jgi:putative two-component system response regulator
LKRIASQLLIVRQKRELLDSKAALKRHADNLEVMVHNKTKEVFALQNAVLATVANLAEFRDEMAGDHITRIRRYLEALIAELIQTGMYADELMAWNLDLFLNSAQLHDVGKLAISALILNKPARLSPEEFELMKTHVTVGVDAIKHIIHHIGKHAFLHHALLIVGSHHEKWDGSGYPAGLTATNIPLEGRLMAIADVYDALVSVRPYKEALSHKEACKIIEEGAGTHFDPALADAFRKVESEFAEIVRRFAA